MENNNNKINEKINRIKELEEQIEKINRIKELEEQIEKIKNNKRNNQRNDGNIILYIAIYNIIIIQLIFLIMLLLGI